MSSKKPFTQTEGEIWINGQFRRLAEAEMPILSHGLHYGSCVFEGERAYEGHIFKSEQHTKRLINSSKLLGFEFPYTVEEFEAAKKELLQRHGLANAYFRAIAWKGSGALGVGSTNNRINSAISLWPMDSYFDTSSEGVRLEMSSWRRPPPQCAPVKAKAAGLYTICTLSKDVALANGYDDALMLDYEGRIAECTGAHIFFVQDGRLITPRADWILDGITRATVIEIARHRQIKIEERFILPDEMSNFSECFIVGSAVEIVPVNEIANHRYHFGALSQQIIEDYSIIKKGRAL